MHEKERRGEKGREREMCTFVHLCDWLAGGHEAESRALLKTICFPAESEGCLDSLLTGLVFLDAHKQYDKFEWPFSKVGSNSFGNINLFNS